MNPILYESRETDFNHNGLGKMGETLSAIVTEVANGEFELEVVYPIGGRLYKHIQDHMLIKAKPNSVDDPHVFRIYEHTIDTVGQTVTIYAHTKSNDLGQNLVKDVVISSLTPQEAMNNMKMNLIEPTDYSFVSDITTRSSTEWKNRNPLNCIAGEEGSLIHYWGGEIKRDNRTIYLYRRRGRDNVAIIRDGKNIDGLSLEYSTKGMVTKVIPYRTYTPEDSDDEVVEYGTPVESQYIGNYPLVYVRAIDYSNDDDVTSLQTMNTKANRYFTENNGVDKPSVNVNMSLVELSDSSEYEKFKDFENVELFDTVTVYSKQYDIQIEAKITTLVYDSLAGKNISIEMGSYRTGLIESTERTYMELIGEKEAKLIQTIQVAANGKNRVFRGVDEPTTGMVKNDLWYKPVGDGETEMYQFDGAYWQLILSTLDTTNVQHEVEAAISEAESAKQAAEQSFTDAVAEADRLVAAQTEAFDAEMTLRKGEILESKEQADLAVSKADSNAESIFGKLDLSVYEANKTKVETNINGLQTTVSNKADKSQITQLETSISTKVESATYNTKMTQLDNAINLRVVQGDVTDAILADKTIKDTRWTNELPSWYFANYPAQRVEEFKRRSLLGVPGVDTCQIGYRRSMGGFFRWCDCPECIFWRWRIYTLWK